VGAWFNKLGKIEVYLIRKSNFQQTISEMTRGQLACWQQVLRGKKMKMASK
jgi:hypothetical protein